VVNPILTPTLSLKERGVRWNTNQKSKMLDSETKSRIDSARDILVGKVPDPKSQVEQITIALIYKFMDDMDRQSEELGGKATFFSKEYKKYAWSRLLDNRLSGHERLLLYAEGIEKMNENKNIPQLFRDIFKSVFLPYRDPETLNLFLKEINGFSYDHSERLGDAFEYLLSVMDSQGSAGQFRTPRHIIDFIVKIVDPRKNETILDPACGTAGFLISSFKHILAQHQNFSSELTPDERGRLMTNFCGYDISPDMVRLSRVNLYLHSFANPRIHEYDTLTSEERWDERYDVILANPPFMTPKGGIRPHNRFSIKATRSEVLFVDYIAEHLNVNGRAGVIVPEGIIFQSQNAYKKLRKMLIENYLWCVVSLPAGCFNPYSGVKTSVLLLDKSMAKRSEEIVFVKVENDGFDLGAQRRPIEKNDLPEALKVILKCHSGLDPESRVFLDSSVKPGNDKLPLAHLVSRKRILENGDINLSGDRYRDTGIRISTKWPMVKLAEVALEIKSGFACGSSDGNSTGIPHLRPMNISTDGQLVWGGTKYISEDVFTDKPDYLLKAGDILFNNTNSKELVGKTCYVDRDIHAGFSNHLTRIRPDLLKIIPRLLAIILHEMWRRGTFLDLCHRWVGQAGVNNAVLSSVEIPLPPLGVQEKIVVELGGYRKIIEGAKQIVTNYKPTLKIDPVWPTVFVSNVLETVKYTQKVQKTQFLPSGRFPIVDQSEEFIAGYWDDETSVFHISKPVILFGDHTRILKYVDFDFVLGADGVKILQPDNRFVPRFFHLALLNSEIPNLGYSRHFKELVRVQIPLPPLDVQHRIVEEIEAERELVEANRKLIKIYEQKIQAKLSEIWGDVTSNN